MSVVLAQTFDFLFFTVSPFAGAAIVGASCGLVVLLIFGLARPCSFVVDEIERRVKW